MQYGMRIFIAKLLRADDVISIWFLFSSARIEIEQGRLLSRNQEIVMTSAMNDFE